MLALENWALTQLSFLCFLFLFSLHFLSLFFLPFSHSFFLSAVMHSIQWKNNAKYCSRVPSFLFPVSYSMGILLAVLNSLKPARMKMSSSIFSPEHFCSNFVREAWKLLSFLVIFFSPFQMVQGNYKKVITITVEKKINAENTMKPNQLLKVYF